MDNLKNTLDLTGSIIANFNNVILILIFTARIYNYPRVEYWLGILFILTIIPFIFILVNSFSMERPVLYYIQLILVIIFIIVELLLDYILKINFRNSSGLVIPYLILFYASFGGMIGVASRSGKGWTIITIISFLIMTASSLIMHFKTST